MEPALESRDIVRKSRGRFPGAKMGRDARLARARTGRPSLPVAQGRLSELVRGKGNAQRVGFLVSLSTLFPLIAAFVYAAGALLIKRAAELGVGVWRTAFVANIVAGIVYQPLWLLGGTIRPELWWQPVVAGLCFVAGQWLTFISLERGDVSVATPVLGLKILLVAVLVTALWGETLGWDVWVAALLATGAIVLLSRRDGSMAHHRVGQTIVTAGLAAAVYALFDIMVQRWAPAWGAGRFVPLALGVSAVSSFAFVPRFRAPLRTLRRGVWPWLLGGSAMMGVQSMLFVTTVARWGDVAAANVIYSSRGLWSVLLVWTLGHWVRSREQELERRVLLARLAGAVLMMAAIGLVLGGR